MKQLVSVQQIIEVEIDESKFTSEFLQEFQENFYPFACVEEHMTHLAQLFAREIADNYSFIEGYGQAEDMGIKFKVEDCNVDVIGESD